MRPSRILARIRAGEPALLASQCFPQPVLAEHASVRGYDGIWLDQEHQFWNPGDLRATLHIIQLLGLDAIIRPPTREKAALYQLLDQGATGVLLPHINTPDEARAAVQALKFPPLGERGLDGCGLDTRHATAIPADYPATANRERFLAVMIESPAAVRQADAIAAVAGVDILFFGPADLFLRLGRPFNPEDAEFREAERIVDAACRRHGKAWGRPCISADDLARTLAAGARLVVHGSDFRALTSHLRDCGADFARLRPRGGT